MQRSIPHTSRFRVRRQLFFGRPAAGSSLGTFGGNVYGDFYGAEPKKTAWLSAEMEGKVVVPRTSFNFNLNSLAGAELSAQPGYPQALQATSLAGYLRALEQQKPRPAPVVEKQQVFIGAPNASTLAARFNIAPESRAGFKYIKTNRQSSRDIKGIEFTAADYYTNTQTVVCDGDLFIPGTLFLNNLTVATGSGCRIYATCPIFLQNAVTQKSLGRTAGLANLQLVSTEAIMLGVGDKSCDPSSKESPLSRRLLSGYAVSTFVTRDAQARSLSPQKVGQAIYDQAKKIASLEDASCHDNAISFSGILLNAPQVHSHYKGKFKGLVIAEAVLFPPGKAEFEFDPVFNKVPILPQLKETDFLLVR